MLNLIVISNLASNRSTTTYKEPEDEVNSRGSYFADSTDDKLRARGRPVACPRSGYRI
jgi:hypothetical protein